MVSVFVVYVSKLSFGGNGSREYFGMGITEAPFFVFVFVLAFRRDVISLS